MNARPRRSAPPAPRAGPRPGPALRLVAAGGCRRRLGDPPGPGIELVADASGKVCAWWHAAGRGRCLHLPGIGAFLPSPRVVVASPAGAGVAPARLRAAFAMVVLPLVLVELGRDLLHASAVETPWGVVGFCGRSGAGKSTLARAGARRGWPRWADDALEFRPGASGVGVASTRLTAAGAGAAPAAPLAALFLLERATGGGGAPTAVEASPLAPAAAFPAVLAHAYAGDLGDPARRRRLARSYLLLVERVPVFALRYPSGRGHLPGALAAVAGALARASSRARSARS